MPHITWHEIMDAIAYWGFFWNAVYVLSPPRGFFKSGR